LLSGQRSSIEKFAPPMRLAHQRRRGVVRVKGPSPIAAIHERLAPGQARLRPFCLSRDPLEAFDALQAKDGLTQPAFVVALLFVLRALQTLEVFHPTWQERTEFRQRPCGHALHVFDRFQERADAFDVLDRLEHGTGPVSQKRGRVHARYVLGNARVNVDTQNIVNQLVLAKINVHGGYREQEGLEDGSSTCVVASQKSLRGQAQVFTHVAGFRVPDTSRSVRERLGVGDNSGRRTTRLPASVAPHCTGHQGVDNANSLIVPQFIQRGAHERAQLCAHSLKTI